jgi:hypothetical protein
MFCLGIIFLLLVAVFGMRVFTAVRWLVFGVIFAIIGLVIFAQFFPATTLARRTLPANCWYYNSFPKGEILLCMSTHETAISSPIGRDSRLSVHTQRQIPDSLRTRSPQLQN